MGIPIDLAQGHAMTDKQRGALAATLLCISIFFGSLALYTALTGAALAATAFTPVALACAVWARDAWRNKP